MTIRMIPLSRGAVAASASGHRAAVLVAGGLFIVDTDHARLVASPSLGFAPDAQRPALLALDERRGRAYVVSPGGPGSVVVLFAIDLASGRVLFGRPLSRRPGAIVEGFAVDGDWGTLFVSLSAPDTLGATYREIIALDSRGRVLRRGTPPFAVGALVADGAHHRLLVTSPLAQELAGLDTQTLATAWRGPAPYLPQSTAYDATRGWVWLLARGGRATVLSVAGGHVMATIALSAPRPADWRQGADLTADARTGAAYISWCTGASGAGLRCGLDRLDPGRATRTTVATQGGLLLGLDPAHGLALTLGADGTVGAWRLGAPQRLATPAMVTGVTGGKVPILLGAAPSVGARAAVTVPDGLLLVLDTTLPLHDDVANASTTDGLALITLTVPPAVVSPGPPTRRARRRQQP